ncbi:clarin-3-like [Acipenser oxyrinchus oxyrinchus]|uniref:Clarin-3-like n=1 Tax=Acipenser oxyrinchus oxyrinchus TaxID=40147 RepID=A0AAD8DEL7_ACIOX|nr:clarin-3-like [Acipenser oxyrinchus oxyrinchus]
MPTIRKTVMFLGGSLANSGSIIMICAVLATKEWVNSVITCKGSANYTGTVTLEYGLFEGKGSHIFCPNIGGDILPFKVLESLEHFGPSKSLHIMVITCLCLGLLGSICSFGITLYNSFSSPYETYLGPIGVYVCSSVSAIFIFFSIILFVVNTEVYNLSVEMAQNQIGTIVTLSGTKNSIGYSYYLMIPAFFCNPIAIIIVYVYQHVDYTQRTEQQRPTEDAPKDVLMY